MMNIYNRKNEMRRKIYSKMLKKGQTKLSTRLCDRVIVRKRVENKCRDHVKKPRAFCKAQTVSELTLTPLRRMHTESRFELVFRHSFKTLTTRVVRKLYLRGMEHIRNNLRCDSNARISNSSDEMRY